MVGSGWAMAIALERGLTPLWALIAIQIVGAALVIGLEYLLPFRTAWLRSHGDLRTDLAHLLISANLVAAVRLAIGIGFDEIAPSGVLHVWPTAWPLAAQVALVISIQSLVGYWIHRAEHGVPLLWRFHAVHHSVPRVYWLNQARVHPIEALLDGLTIAPVVLLGARQEVVLVFTALASMHLLLQHANIDLRLGPLNWVVSMCEAHRWHHSKTRTEADANFGGVLIIWDVVFGTRVLPRDREPPADTGFADQKGYPVGYVDQLASPFRAALWRNR